MPKQKTITLNADLGEGFDYDAQIMPLIDIANIACGEHAGDEQTMHRTLQLAKQHRVAISAHPGYPDRNNFGRHSMQLAEDALYQSIAEQLSRIKNIADKLNCSLTYIKPHGALYNDCAGDPKIAECFVKACSSFDKNLIIIGLADSHLIYRASSKKIKTLAEGFIDRRYRDDGKLAPRGEKDSCIDDIEQACAQALQIAAEGHVDTIGNNKLALNVSTLCLHGDSPAALALASRVSALLRPYR